ncbi:WD40 repeat-like protein [Pseudovirgaria hyperparasitica]|uniref:WD40 repeat-like protein n=1 Tax=Pseudovirgaria hyperparasitica TaxID=470096 RepID=A0A6A6VVP6_9PEZI|nr:WD40 repeat-like protein [Pseudovirgaria hyperparasitica]KAF2754652.1 WD40 repeat-like protein [Pseudovirgaria hyperparasitica]
MSRLTPIASTNLGLPSDTYVYSIVSTAPFNANGRLAIISSDDSLRLIDATTLQLLLPDGLFTLVNRSVTCLKRASADGNVLSTCGRDGEINCWDLRSHKNVSQIKAPRGLPLSALEWNPLSSTIAAGVELDCNPPGEAPVFIWDMRNVARPKLELLESHNDTITDLHFSSTHPSLLLSCATDGLVNVFETEQPNEEDALHQIINHKSAVHHAGFLRQSNSIYALSTDEVLSTYSLQGPDEIAVDPDPTHHGDLRERLGCEYIVNIVYGDSDAPFVAAGSHSRQSLTLYPFPLADSVDVTWELAGAHGDDIVRDVLVDAPTSTVFTCGEDGQVKAWKQPSSPYSTTSSAKEGRQGRKAKGKKGGFHPY